MSEHYRNELNTIAMRNGKTQRYDTEQSGPQDRPTWRADVYLNDMPYGTGAGNTKAEAKEAAAHNAIQFILEHGL